MSAQVDALESALFEAAPAVVIRAGKGAVACRRLWVRSLARGLCQGVSAALGQAA